jgi:hypothetical protein
LDKQRQLLAEAANLYGRRGTAWGLSRSLEIYSGVTPQIFEPADQPHSFSVVLHRLSDRQIDRAAVERIIEANKPAQTSYSLYIFPLDQNQEAPNPKEQAA